MNASDYALPKDRAYPMHTESHAKDSLQRAAQSATPQDHQKVRAAIHKRYPHLAKKHGNMSPNEAPGKDVPTVDTKIYTAKRAQTVD